MKNRLHFIAIGGAAMHNLALALQQNGYVISGSDDEIMEPSRSRLATAGLLPPEDGWFPEKITNKIDGVILGMHARADNPELLEAQRAGIPVYSFPEFLFEHSKNKLRVVVGGSHGKTTITSMILHVLRKQGFDFDYMVGAKIEGFDTMVRLSNAPLIILEGDEYLSSPVDRRPKFHLYQAEIGLISGIAWDHINVFPTYENYLDQFRIFAENIPANGSLIYCSDDPDTNKIAQTTSIKAEKISYSLPDYEIENGITSLKINGSKIELSVFGKHNLTNMQGARLVCQKLGISEENFYKDISDFKGASRRLELLSSTETISVFRDFAHSPSKLKATVQAVRDQFPDRKLIACMELHTFSSLNEDFLAQYEGTIDPADIAYVYYNPHTIEHKKLKQLDESIVKKAFKNSNLFVYTDSKALQKELNLIRVENSVYLMMSSGNFDGMDLKIFAERITGISSLVQSN